MFWSKSVTRAETEADADIVVEGKIGFLYLGRIPGLEGRDSQIGVHHLFDDCVKIVRANQIGLRLWNSTPSHGFWTYRGQTSLKIGDHVRVSLLWHENAAWYPTFFPYPGSESVADLQGAKVPMILRADNGQIRDMPLRYGIVEGQFDPLPPMWFRLFRLDSNPSDAMLAYNVWKQAWPGTPQVTFQVVEDILGLPRPGYHYSVYFARVAPFQDSRRLHGRVFVETLAYTTWPVPGSADGSGSIVFNTDTNWSPIGGGDPAGDQYDFVSVMTHEMGHSLGVGHLNSDADNVMYESIANGEKKRTLKSPDIDAMTNIYG